MSRWLFFVIAVCITVQWCYPCPNLNLSTQCYEKQKEYVSRLYGTKTTYTTSQTVLDTNIHINHKLTKGYRPIIVYAVFRHAIRYPDAEDIEQMSYYLPLFQQDILNNKGELCKADVEAFRNWKLNMVPEDDNNVSDSGREETILTALRLRKMFKKNFDPEKADINFGVTPKIRTTQTAEAFITGLRISEIVKDTVCDDDSSESEEDKYRKQLNDWNPEKKVLNFLSFHDECKKIIKSKGGKLKKPKQAEDFRKSDLIARLAKSVKQRLGIVSKTNLSDWDFVEVISRACKFGFAIDRSSPWCAAFGTPELKILEYYEDLEDYLDDGYGRDMNLKMPCPLMDDLISKIKNPLANTRLQTYLHFTHAGALKRFWAYLGLFPDDSLMTNATPEEGVCRRTKRNWRSSLNTPFGANVVFAVFEPKRKKRSSSDYRVIAYVNGKAERIRNCDRVFCRLDQFVQQFQDVRTCNLDSICKPSK